MATNEADRKREIMTVKNAVDLVAHHGHVVARAEVPHEAKDEVRQKNKSRKCESECSDPCSSVLNRAVLDPGPAAEGRQKNRSRKCESECSDPCSSVLSRAVLDPSPAAEGRQKSRSRKCGSECSDPCSSDLNRAVPAVKQAVNRHATVIRLAKQCVNDFRNT